MYLESSLEYEYLNVIEINIFHMLFQIMMLYDILTNSKNVVQENNCFYV
jgi:hypothetical protein